MVGILNRGRNPNQRRDVLIEEKVTLHGCDILGPVKIGFRSYANDSLLRNVTIGRFCSIGRRCSIGAAHHNIEAFSTHPSTAGKHFVRDPATTIGNDVWIGDNVVLMAGLAIGDGAVISAGAIVTDDVAPYAIVGGAPARLLRYRFGPQTIAALIESQWWRYGDNAVRAAGADAPPEVLLAALAAAKPQPMEPQFKAWTPPA